MKQRNSYKIQDFASDLDKEIFRLKAQIELFWEKELKMLRSFGLRDGMSIIECGSGPGFLLEKLLEAFPSSLITGFDIDPCLVEKSREVLRPWGEDRVRISEQSIMNTDYPDESFDFAIARLVIEHLPDPINAAKEVRRILKTGGKAVFIDNDFDLHLRAHPDIPELDDLYQAYCRRGRANGGNPRIGRELPCVLQEAGFSNIDLEVVGAHSRLVGDEAFLKSEGSGIPAQLFKEGYLPREILDRLVLKWHDILEQEDHAFFRQLFVAAGEKLQLPKTEARSASKKEDRKADPDLVRRITSEGTPEERTLLLIPYLQAQIGALLKTGPIGVPVDVPFITLGLDSILSVELASGISRDMGLTLSVVDILTAQSITAFAAQLTGSSPGKGRGPSEDGDWEDGEL